MRKETVKEKVDEQLSKSVRVVGDSSGAAMYDGTSDVAFGPIMRGGQGSAERMMNQFLDWLPQSARNYNADELTVLKTAWKIEAGYLDEQDWMHQAGEAEQILGREIQGEGSL